MGKKRSRDELCYRTGYSLNEAIQSQWSFWRTPYKGNEYQQRSSLKKLTSNLEALIGSNTIVSQMRSFTSEWIDCLGGASQCGATAGSLALDEESTYHNFQKGELRLPKFVSGTMWWILFYSTSLPQLEDSERIELTKNLHTKLQHSYKPDSFNDGKEPSYPKLSDDEKYSFPIVVHPDNKARQQALEQMQEDKRKWFLEKTKTFFADQKNWPDKDLDYIEKALDTAFDVFTDCLRSSEHPPSSQTDSQSNSDPVVVVSDSISVLNKALFTACPVYRTFEQLMKDCIDQILQCTDKTEKHWFILGLYVDQFSGLPPFPPYKMTV